MLTVTNSTVNGVSQPTVMQPFLITGTRRQFTHLDYAGLADIGWQVPPSAAVSSVLSATPLATSSVQAPVTTTLTFSENLIKKLDEQAAMI